MLPCSLLVLLLLGDDLRPLMAGRRTLGAEQGKKGVDESHHHHHRRRPDGFQGTLDPKNAYLSMYGPSSSPWVAIPEGQTMRLSLLSGRVRLVPGTAYHLARSGRHVVVVDKGGQPASGMTSLSSAIVRTHYTHEILARMAVYSLGVLSNFGHIGESGFVNAGLLIVAPRGGPRADRVHRPDAQQRRCQERDLGQGHGYGAVSRLELRRVRHHRL